MNAPHPAKYHDAILEEIEKFVGVYRHSPYILDPFGGTGKLKQVFPQAICMDIEPEWARMSGLQADATRLPFANGQFDLIVTSPTYGNRMADHFNARDGSKRMTYRHQIGHALNERNTGRMQWGTKYKKMHEFAWAECWRVLSLFGGFALNVKNHIRAGKEINVAGWHLRTLNKIGFVEKSRTFIETPSMGFGANADLRVPGEWLFFFVKGT